MDFVFSNTGSEKFTIDNIMSRTPAVMALVSSSRSLLYLFFWLIPFPQTLRMMGSIFVLWLNYSFLIFKTLKMFFVLDSFHFQLWNGFWCTCYLNCILAHTYMGLLGIFLLLRDWWWFMPHNNSFKDIKSDNIIISLKPHWTIQTIDIWITENPFCI